MQTKDQSFLGTEPVGKLLVRLAVPTVIAQLVNMLYNIVDRIYIGHIAEIGSLALTGVGVCMPIIMIVTAFAALVASGSAPRASIALGRGDHDTAEKLLGGSFSLQIAISLLLTAVLLLFGHNFLLAFGASENTIEYADSYLNIYALGTLFVELTLGMNAFITAQGFATTGMLTVLIGAVCNIILDPILMFVLHMGVRGAALATIISQGISAAFVVTFLVSGKSYLKIRIPCLKVEKSVLMPAIALGAAPFVMQFTESILNICFNTSLQRYGGDIAVGSMTICSSVMQFSLLPLMGMCQGAQPIISFNYGARKIHRVDSAFRLLLITCLGYATVLWAVAMFIPHVFTGIFTQDQALTGYAVWALRIYMAASLMFGAQIACQQTFISLGDSKTSLFLALLRKVFLLIPLIYLLPRFFENKVMAVFLAEPIADAVAVCTTVALFVVSFRKLKRELGG